MRYGVKWPWNQAREIRSKGESTISYIITPWWEIINSIDKPPELHFITSSTNKHFSWLVFATNLSTLEGWTAQLAWVIASWKLTQGYYALTKWHRQDLNLWPRDPTDTITTQSLLLTKAAAPQALTQSHRLSHKVTLKWLVRLNSWKRIIWKQLHTQ